MINDLAVNNLIILYILNKTNLPIDSSQLTDFMIQNDYSTFFDAQQYFTNLHKSNFIHKINQNKKTIYMITPDGSNALNYFINRIPKHYYNVLDEFCLKIINENSDITIYDSIVLQNDNDKYEVNCKITKNNFEILNIKIYDLTKEHSEKVSKLWKDNGKEIYKCLQVKLEL